MKVLHKICESDFRSETAIQHVSKCSIFSNHMSDLFSVMECNNYKFRCDFTVRLFVYLFIYLFIYYNLVTKY